MSKVAVLHGLDAQRQLVVILGAGASYGARVVPSPPLGKDLLTYLNKYLQIIKPFPSCPFSEDQREQLGRLIDSATEHQWTYEQLVDQEVAKDDADNKNLVLLNYLTAAAFSPMKESWRRRFHFDEAFSEREDTYDDFLNSLKNSGYGPTNLTFITLNYDLLLEQAIERVIGPGGYNYHLTDNHKGGYDLFKIHGSINWWGHLGRSQRLPCEDLKPGVELTNQGATFPNVSVEENPYRACLNYGGTSDPVMAHYGLHKRVFVNAELLQTIRSNAISECGRATQAFVVGVHPPDSPQEDEALWGIFTALVARNVPTQYVGLPPDTEVVAKKFSFCTVAKTFKEFVETL